MELVDEIVHLKRDDGKEIEVPLERLSDKDQKRAIELHESVGQEEAIDDNPFD